MATILMTLALSDTSGASLVALRYASALRERGHEVALAYGPTGRPGAPLHAPIVPRFEELGAVAEYVPALARPIGSAAPAAVAALARRVGAAAIVGWAVADPEPAVMSLIIASLAWAPLLPPSSCRALL